MLHASTVTGRYSVYVVDLAGNSWPVLHTGDPVEALCRFYAERNKLRRADGQLSGTCGISDSENDGRDCVMALEEDEAMTCTRWGAGPDRCIEPFQHLGPCRDAQGNSTLTLAAKLLSREVVYAE